MDHRYFYKSQIEKVKAIHECMISHLDDHFTLEQLAGQYDISLTTMKECFKKLYGDSMYSYLKRYRMNAAAIMLKENPKSSIRQIGQHVGYSSAGKFSVAFKQVMGITPMEYRGSTL